MALIGIIGFLTFERILTIISDLYNNAHTNRCNRASGEINSNHNHNAGDNKPDELEKLNKTGDNKDEKSNANCSDTIELTCMNSTNTADADLQLTTEQCHRETIAYPDADLGYVVKLTDHHHHHHHHQPPQGLTSIVFTIITGDGLHNFFGK